MYFILFEKNKIRLQMSFVRRAAIFRDNLRIAIKAIQSNRVRAILTICIIAFGIMALVGILTAIDAVKSSLTSQFTMMGANSFTISSRGMNIRLGNTRTRIRNYSRISYREAMDFKALFTEAAWVSVSFNATSFSTVKYGTEETNPNVSLIGVDENYLSVSGYEVENGRNFSPEEVQMNRRLVLLGSEIAAKIFPGGVDPVGKDVTVAGLKLQVAGVLKSKGASALTGDQICLMPVTAARQYFSRPNMNFNITIMPVNPVNLDVMAGEAEVSSEWSAILIPG
jgi:putative ABC transport system permease protein